MIMRNPRTGEQVVIHFALVWSFLFGVFYLAYKRCLITALLNLVLAIITVGISWFVLPFLSEFLMLMELRAKGFSEWNPEDEPEESDDSHALDIQIKKAQLLKLQREIAALPPHPEETQTYAPKRPLPRRPEPRRAFSRPVG